MELQLLFIIAHYFVVSHQSVLPSKLAVAPDIVADALPDKLHKYRPNFDQNRALPSVKENDRDNNPGAIIGGDIATAKEFPWHAVIMYDDDFICGGTLLNSRTVITAQHCVDNDIEQRYGNYEIILGLGSFKNFSNTQRIGVSSVIPYDTSGRNDLALMHLDSDASYNSYVQKVPAIANSKFSKKKAVKSDSCYVIGFGVYKSSNPYKSSSELRKLNIGLVGWKTCKKFMETTLGRGNQITNKMICNLDTHGSDCYGDSGGGVGCFVKNKFTLVGLVSWGPDVDCLVPPSVYVKISSYKSWIEKNMS